MSLKTDVEKRLAEFRKVRKIGEELMEKYMKR